MAATVSLRSHTARWILPTALVFCSAGQTALAQAPPAQPNTAGALSRDLTRPQAQPSLTVDRDPILSPDLEEKTPAAENAPAGAPSVSGGRQTGDRALTKQGNGFVLRADVDEVLLPCTVVDDKGRLVTNLDRGNFQVWEDNVPQKIASFQHQDVPVSLGILVDNSGSMSKKRPSVNKSALDLLEASNPQDEAFVVNFSDEAFIDQEFTSDVNKLRDGLGHIESRGGTALYDAVVASADKLAQDAKRPKQVLIIITDGEDNASTLNLEQTIHRVQELSGPVVYTIGLLFGDEMSRAEVRHARRALEMLSGETGGMAFFPKSIEQIDEIAAEVARDIRSQYTIGYHSTKPSTQQGFRRVDVTAQEKGEGKLTVRTRTGYFPVVKAAKKAAQAGN